jgi:lipopolysaccharide export system permease protein
MRIYERYFARQIYLTFIFILFAFSGLFFFFDLINELNSVGHGNYKFQYAVLRVALQTPSRFYEIIPVAALISAIYVFAQMAANSSVRTRISCRSVFGSRRWDRRYRATSSQACG